MRGFRLLVGSAVASAGGLGLLVSLTLRWADLLVLYKTDQVRDYYAGYALAERLGGPGGLITALVALAGLGAILAATVAEATVPERIRRAAMVSVTCGAVAVVAVALGCVAVLAVGPPRSAGQNIGSDARAGLGVVVAAISAVVVLAGGLHTRRSAELRES